jgi:tetratricopeptide (TPR) repeat protein
MRRSAALVLVLTLLFSPVEAADRLQTGPAAAWVLPPEPPDATVPAATDAALQVLLSDQQIRITGEAVDSYSASRVRIQTPQGLGALGTIRFSWNPDTDVLTVHELSATRGGQRRDLLGSGADFTVLRREDQLEQAVLTGTLTAVLQPPGLQVGDIVDMRYTLSRRDPVVADTPDGVHVWPNATISKVRLRMLWPESLPLRRRASSFMPPAEPVRKDGWVELNFQTDNLVPLLQPSGAPARFAALRMVEYTTFQDWQHLSRRFAPLYERASTLAPNSPLRAEVRRIREQNKTDAARAAAALRLVQDQIRYVLLAMNDGGLVPASADETWQRKFGDCKAKTALLLALLRELGIDAEPVAVSSGFGDGMDARLSAIGLFDHVLVRSRVEGRTYWLDGTRLGDRSLARIEAPPFLWALPLVARGSDLVPIPQQLLQEPQILRTLEIDAREGIELPAPFRAQMVMKGDSARSLQRNWDNVPAANRDEGLRAFWREQYNGLTIEKTDAAFDDELGQLTWTASGTILMEWDPEYNTYQPFDMDLGYRADYTRPRGTDAQAPYGVAFPTYERNTESIRLPPSSSFTVTGKDIDTKVAAIEYRRKARIENGTFVAETNVRSLAPEFPAGETAEAQRVLLDMSRNNLYLKKPARYLPTVKELQSQAGKPLKSAADHVERGEQMMSRNLLELGIAEFDRALQLDAKLERALVDRAAARNGLGQLDAGKADLLSALVVNPDNLNAKRMLAAMEADAGRLQQAIEQMDQVIGKDALPIDRYLRGRYYALSGSFELALRDVDAALAGLPPAAEPNLLKVELLRRLNRQAEIAAVADTLLQALAGTEDGVMTVAGLLGSTGERARAQDLLDRTIRSQPSARLYVQRARLREDKKGALTDLQEAVKLDPTPSIRLAVVRALMSHKLHREALDALVEYEKQAAVTATSANLRGVSLWHLGDKTAAQAAFAQARDKTSPPGHYNNICWDKGIYDAALDEALKECDSALEKEPDCGPCMDSRGFVLLRMGRLPEAVAAYNDSLVQNPQQGASLAGRGLALLRLGDREAGERDLLKARIVSPGVEQTFDSYGVRR